MGSNQEQRAWSHTFRVKSSPQAPALPALREPNPWQAWQPRPLPPSGHPKLTLEQMKQMADVQTSTLIEKSKFEPKNASLLVEIAGIYQTHLFKEAADYSGKALRLSPRTPLLAQRWQPASIIPATCMARRKS
jgi:hypothetical protein